MYYQNVIVCVAKNSVREISKKLVAIYFSDFYIQNFRALPNEVNDKLDSVVLGTS